MDTFDDFRRGRFGGDLAASSMTFNARADGTAATLMRKRLLSLYDAPSPELPDAFRRLLTQVSTKLDRK